MPIHYNASLFVVAILALAYDTYLIWKKGYRSTLIYYVGYAATILGSFVFILAFLLDEFSLVEVYNYSARSMDLYLKLASSWSGSGGFIIWWLLFFSIIALIHRYSVMRSNVDDKEVESYQKHFIMYNLAALVLTISLFAADTFQTFTVAPIDGVGLNPLLKSFWNYFHPPSAILSYALSLVVGISAISKVPRRFTNLMASLAWLMVTIANILGGIWSYFTLGWGGYWAWDPVETALLMPWLSLTAYFHAIYFNKEFRDSLLSLTGFSVAFAAYITRGGVYSPLHGFGGISISSALLLLMGLPFLGYAISEMSKLSMEAFYKSLRSLYEMTLSVSSLAILGIYFVSFITLASQSLYTVFTGGQLALDVSLYNYLSAPFTLIFIALLPGCSAYFLFRDNKRFLLYSIAPSVIGAVALTVFTVSMGGLWSPLSSTVTNALISIFIPFSLVALIATTSGLIYSLFKKEYRDIGLKILHLSIPLMLIAIVISGPFAYNQAYFRNYKVTRGDTIDFGGLSLQYIGADFIGPVGEIAIPGAANVPNLPTVPEEVEAFLKFRVVDGAPAQEVTMKVRFNFGSFFRGHGGIVAEPMVIDSGLDEYYFVFTPTSGVDLLYMYAKIIHDRIQQTEPGPTQMIYVHVIAFIAQNIGVEPQQFYNASAAWSPDTADLQSYFIISYKKVPMVKLLWISSVIMILGEVLTIILRRIPRHRRD